MYNHSPPSCHETRTRSPGAVVQHRQTPEGWQILLRVLGPSSSTVPSNGGTYNGSTTTKSRAEDHEVTETALFQVQEYASIEEPLRQVEINLQILKERQRIDEFKR